MGSSSHSEDQEASVIQDSKHQQQQQQLMGMPTWLNSAILSRPATTANAGSSHEQELPENQRWNNPSYVTNWLSGSRASDSQQQHHATTAELLVEQQQQQQQQQQVERKMLGGSGAEVGQEDGGTSGDLEECSRYQNAGLKADIVTHPLYDQLLEAHVACLRIATPVDQLSRIDGQISQWHHVIAKYSILANHQLLCGSTKEELDHFMAHYVMLLKSFKEQLQHHVRVHAKEAVMACWELEQSLISLTGAAPGEGTGATMSDDEEEQQSESDYWQDNLGFGPLIPTETERTLMERVRQELKHELKQGYRARIVDVREEILRKRRAGKLPGDTTSVLKAWWHAHSKWPYPTEDEKARLVQETGLELKQINNWFINQRKRNWHHHPSSSTSTSKSKCKSSTGELSGKGK